MGVTCPRCRGEALSEALIRHCPRCKGSWVSEQVLEERVAERGGRGGGGGGLHWHLEARAALPCAVCAEPMETLLVRGAPVDRCPPHGFWFDANELAHVLGPAAVVAAAAIASEQQPPRDGESTAADVAEVVLDGVDVVATAGEVLETGGGVFEVVAGGVGVVAEVVVDVLAGIFSIFEDLG